jgi:hypothetical protein
MSDLTRQRLIESLGNLPSPTRREVRARAALSYVLAGIWMVAIYAAAGTLEHATTRASALTLVIASGLSVVAALASAAVLSRSSSPLGRSHFSLAMFTGVVPFAVLAWLSLWQPHELHESIPVGWRCHALSLGIGVAPLIALAVAKRHSEPQHPRWLGAAFGAIAGAWAAVLVAAWCPLFDLSHALLGHVAPILVLIATGAALASSQLRLSIRSG